ncbi:gastric inhibitory polypeptide-like [Myxocyprinus asiaticus]|uniref:gastric inhibitory polypeptide-like n=1 Tax=Myxocyprinus asiaticus TaxID=70543 RepID=UPI0022224218|nr:gastric inhibitory polypeptide-like [Myxocyprinus asiaticus]
MKAAVCALVCICLGSTWKGAASQPVDSSSNNDIQKLSRRYAESTIASDISKIMDSMVQKNFVNFLLDQKEKKSDSTNDIQKLNRRYAESTIASDISKIMDSMVQKNFVNFLLNQREKKSVPTAGDPDISNFNDLLKKEFVMWLHSKGSAFKNQ